MLALARDGTIQRAPAQRVIVDMETHHEVLHQAEELPLCHFREAARRYKHTVSPVHPFGELGIDGATSHLSWVHPPTWPEIQVSLKEALNTIPSFS